MEMGYVDHLHDTVDRKSSHSVKVEEGQTLSVSMTATMDTVGNLVLGKKIYFSSMISNIIDLNLGELQSHEPYHYIACMSNCIWRTVSECGFLVSLGYLCRSSTLPSILFSL